jgi:ABC-type cobalt transport system substrate-binding protein
MGILDNLENAWDEIDPKYESLAQKIFSETVCSECESKLMPVTDNMGREIFWGDLGRPTDA